MNILVIGNGFDLEHNLATTYIDFLEYIRAVWHSPKIREDLRSEIDDNMPILVKKDYSGVMKEVGSSDLMLDKRLEEVFQLSKDNIWIKHFFYIRDEINGGWIDFESEICRVIRCMDSIRTIRQTSCGKDNYAQYHELYDLETKIFDMINSELRTYEISKVDYEYKVIARLIEDLNKLIRCLEIYLSDWIGKKEIEYIAPDIVSISPELHGVLSFNYTDTYQKMYDLGKRKIEYDYIHGKSQADRAIDENNMVLGIDEYLTGEARNTELDFIEFKKYFQRIHKETGCKYMEWVERLKKNNGSGMRVGNQKIEPNHIYIFGHSLDITDKDILKELIDRENTITTIFYCNKRVYAKQIANLVNILGQDKLIERVHGSKKTIVFKQQQQRVTR